MMRKALWPRNAGSAKEKVVEETWLMAQFRELPPAFLLSREEIHMGAPIGEGAFGMVSCCKVEKWSTKPLLACKVVKPHRLNKADERQLRNEVIIWQQMDHPNMVMLHGLSIEPKECRLVCEFCAGGTLEDTLEAQQKRRAPRGPVHERIDQMLQIASAMERLHALGYMHRDLKTGNVLVEGSVLKLSDFGLARERPARKESLTAETGSYRWMAPEVMRHEPYDEKCDVYSFALFCWALLTRSQPFPSLSAVEAAFAVADGAKRPRMPECPPDLASMIESCWAQKSDVRPSFVDVVQQLGELGTLGRPEQAAPAAVAAPATLAPSPTAPIVLPVAVPASEVNKVRTAAAALDAAASDEPPLKLTRSPEAALRREMSPLFGDIQVLTLTQQAVALSPASGWTAR